MINRSKMRRQLYSNGGTTRQHYGLGSLVKKAVKSVTKPIKQIFKSDAGRAALLGAGLYGLGGGTFFGKGFPGMGGGFKMGNILSNIQNLSTMGKAALGTGAAALAFGGGDPTKTEGFDMAKRKGDVESYLRKYYRQYKQSDWQTGWTQDEEDKFVARYTSEYNQGGRVGLQTGGQPVVDERMKNTLEENVRMNNLQKELNERVKKGNVMGGLEPQDRFINRVSDYDTSNLYGIKPQAYNMNTPTTPVNQANVYGSYLNQGLRPEQIKAISYYDTLQKKYGDQGMMAVSAAPPMFHQGQSVAMPMGGGLASFTGVAPGTSPLAAEKFFKTPAEMFAQYQEGLRRSMLMNPNSGIYFDADKTYDAGDYVSPKGIYTFRDPDPNERRGMMIDGKEYFSEQEAIADMGIERYNQVMSKGGRVGLYAGSPDPDDMETLSTLEIMSDQGIPYGEQVKKEGIKSLEAGAPDLRRMGNMETEDSQLVEKYMEHKQEADVPMSFDEFEKYQSMTAFGGPFAALRKLGFKSNEISNLFRNLATMGKEYKTNENFKQLYRLLANPMENKEAIIGIMQEYGKKIPKVLKEKIKKKKVKKKKTRKKKSIGGIMGARVGLRAMQDLIDDEDEEYAAQGGRIGYAGGTDYYTNLYMRYAQDMINDGNEPMSIEDFVEIIKETERTGNAQGGRIGYRYGGGGADYMPVGSLAMNEENVPQMFVSDEAGALPKMDGGVLPGDLGNLTIDDFENIEDYMRYLRMINQNNQGGRVGQMYGTGPQGLPGIPRMASDGMEFDMRAEGGFQPLGAKEGKDDVPAMLAKNEFVFTADAVRGAGDGDIEKGAQRMYDTMKKLEGKIA